MVNGETEQSYFFIAHPKVIPDLMRKRYNRNQKVKYLFR